MIELNSCGDFRWKHKHAACSLQCFHVFFRKRNRAL